MRQTINKNQPTKSVNFLYNTKFGSLILKIATRRWLSKLAGWYLDRKVSRGRIKKYIKKNHIDMSQFETVKYKSFNDFFTRKIKPELRPIDMDDNSFISPSDGKISAYHITVDGNYEIKGHNYTINSLLRDEELAKKYMDGLCVVVRLAVDDYHRYIYIDDCLKNNNIFIKGKLHTVQPYALSKKKVFTENCREYTVMKTKNFGDVVQVEVGALMVGRISNNHQSGNYSRGQEKGKFEFGGSTIVLLIEKDKVILDEEFFTNTQSNLETIVKCGEKIGTKYKKDSD